MPRLDAIVTIVADAVTLGDVKTFLDEAERYSLPPTAPLLDGGHTRVEGFEQEAGEASGEEGASTLGSVRAWYEAARAAGIEDDASILVGGDTLAVDLLPLEVEAIGCGDCDEHDDVLVTVHGCTRRTHS